MLLRAIALLLLVGASLGNTTTLAQPGQHEYLPQPAQGEYLPRQAQLATATIDVDHPGPPIPPTFMGFSHEWSSAPLLVGAPSTGTNPIYRQLV
ncbi:MAG: hypothetical protein JOY61_22265, partial [Chloroflexi bacterium]|nr:hypothetical protein [Chloroflexota bacterium]